MPTKSKDYTQLRQELDDIVRQLQDPDCDVDQAAQLFAAAIKAIDALEKHLEQAENRVSKVKLDRLTADEA